MTKLKTFFAKPDRTTRNELLKKISIIEESKVIDGILLWGQSILAILDENRQILKVNTNFFKKLGIDESEDLLGLRPGEAIRCKYSDLEEGGCGTSRYCSTCGAAIAIVSTLDSKEEVERTCSINNHVFKVKALTITMDRSDFVLLFIEDITKEYHRETINRAFFHNVKNILNGIVGASELLSSLDTTSELTKVIHSSSLILQKEIEIQKDISFNEDFKFDLKRESINIGSIYNELKSIYSIHPLKLNKNIKYIDPNTDISFISDRSILLRILNSMITNALEASELYSVVKVWVENHRDKILFRVHNEEVIPEDIKLRVFQKQFSTKSELGRGFGTYTMKLFGEKYLGGEMTFNSDDKVGTIFTLALPKS